MKPKTKKTARKFSLNNIGWAIEGFLADLFAIRSPVPVRVRNQRKR